MSVDRLAAAFSKIAHRIEHAPECLIIINLKMSALAVMRPPCTCDYGARVLRALAGAADSGVLYALVAFHATLDPKAAFLAEVERLADPQEPRENVHE